MSLLPLLPGLQNNDDDTSNDSKGIIIRKKSKRPEKKARSKGINRRRQGKQQRAAGEVALRPPDERRRLRTGPRRFSVLEEHDPKGDRKRGPVTTICIISRRPTLVSPIISVRGGESRPGNAPGDGDHGAALRRPLARSVGRRPRMLCRRLRPRRRRPGLGGILCVREKENERARVYVCVYVCNVCR